MSICQNFIGGIINVLNSQNNNNGKQRFSETGRG